VARTIGRILLTLTGLAITGFVLLVLIGLLDRHEQEITAGLSRIYDRYLAPQAGASSNPRARAAAEAERAGVVGRGREVATTQPFQEQPKLVGTGAVGSANQGMSVALSADGNTAIVGGPGANNADRDRPPSVGPAGAAWVFTRRGGVWRQQAKLVGTTSEYGGGLWSQGASVAVSADGNTAIVGGPSDHRTTGAAWVFTRSGDAWTQQGNKLLGSGAGEHPLPLGQGMSVALSAAPLPTSFFPCVQLFTRSGSVWTQQGKKLIGASYSVGADELFALLRPDTATAGEYPYRPGLTVVGPPGKACPSRYPLTATPPSWVGLETTCGIDGRPLASARPARRGCLPAVAVSGHSKTNWSAPVRWDA
jgi:hypothetical protein